MGMQSSKCKNYYEFNKPTSLAKVVASSEANFDSIIIKIRS